MTGTLVEKKEMLEFVSNPQPQPPRIAKGIVRALVHRQTAKDKYDTVGLPYTGITIFDNGGKSPYQIITDSLGQWSATLALGAKLRTQFAGPYQRLMRHDDDDDGQDTLSFGSSDTILWTDAS